MQVSVTVDRFRVSARPRRPVESEVTWLRRAWRHQPILHVNDLQTGQCCETAVAGHLLVAYDVVVLPKTLFDVETLQILAVSPSFDVSRRFDTRALVSMKKMPNKGGVHLLNALLAGCDQSQPGILAAVCFSEAVKKSAEPE